MIEIKQGPVIYTIDTKMRIRKIDDGEATWIFAETAEQAWKIYEQECQPDPSSTRKVEEANYSTKYKFSEEQRPFVDEFRKGWCIIDPDHIRFLDYMILFRPQEPGIFCSTVR